MVRLIRRLKSLLRKNSILLLPLLEQLNFRGVIMGSVKLETVSQGRGYHQ
jgi:hypothetical protein